MSFSILNLKNTRSLESIIDAANRIPSTDEIASGQNGKHLKTRVKEALTHTGQTALLAKITGCQRGALCSSVYCTTCHGRWTKQFRDAVERYMKKTGMNDAQARARLRYATVICEVTALSPAAVRKAMDRARAKMKAVHRHYRKLWYHGAFDLELIRPDLLGEHKFETIKEMAEIGLSVPQKAGETYVLVHFHALIDTGEYANGVRSRINMQFGQASRQVRLDSLYKDRPLDESFAKISNYAYKHEWKYKSSFDPKEIGLLAYLPAKELSFLISLYDDLKGTNGRGLGLNGKPKPDPIEYNNELVFV